MVQRQGHAARVLAIDDGVTELVQALKKQGLQSPYLRNFVVARRRGVKMAMDEALDKAARAAQRFDAGKIGVDDLARSGGGPSAE